MFAISSSAALFSPSVKEQYLDLLPNVVFTDSVGASETGFTGLGYVSAGNKKPTARPSRRARRRS